MNLVVCQVDGGPRKAPEKGLQCAQLRHWRQGKKNKNNNNIIKNKKTSNTNFLEVTYNSFGLCHFRGGIEYC